MNACLVSNFKILTAQIKYLAVIFIVMAPLTMFFGDFGYGAFFGFVLIGFPLQMISVFSYEDKSKATRFFFSVPCGRANYVNAKYVTAVFLVLLSVLLCGVYVFVANALSVFDDVSEMLFLTVIMATASFILLALIIPFVIKVGSEKAGIIISSSCLVFGGAMILIGKFLDKTGAHVNMDISPNMAALGLCAMCIIVTGLLSYKISMRIVFSKDA